MRVLTVNAIAALEIVKRRLQEEAIVVVRPAEIAPLDIKIEEPKLAKREEKRLQSRVKMRHARVKNQHFQRMCQRRDWSSPVWKP